MRRAKLHKLIAGPACLPALLFLVTMQLQAAPLCGPGDGWLADCPAGTSELWATASLELVLNDGTADLVELAGRVVLQNDAPSGGVMETEILSMTLTGGSPVVGPVRLVAGPALITLPPCRGRLSAGAATQTTDPWMVESFFDVFFEIDFTPPVGGTSRLCNPDDPSLLVAAIRSWPPLNIPLRAAPVGLVDADGTPQGSAGLTLTLIPEPSSLILVGSAALLLLLRRHARCQHR